MRPSARTYITINNYILPLSKHAGEAQIYVSLELVPVSLPFDVVNRLPISFDIFRELLEVALILCVLRSEEDDKDSCKHQEEGLPHKILLDDARHLLRLNGQDDEEKHIHPQIPIDEHLDSKRVYHFNINVLVMDK